MTRKKSKERLLRAFIGQGKSRMIYIYNNKTKNGQWEIGFPYYLIWAPRSYLGGGLALYGSGESDEESNCVITTKLTKCPNNLVTAMFQSDEWSKMKKKIDGLRPCPQQETVSRQVVSTEKAFAYRCSGQVSTRTGQRVQRVADSFPGCPEQRGKIRPLVTKKKRKSNSSTNLWTKAWKIRNFFSNLGNVFFQQKGKKHFLQKKEKVSRHKGRRQVSVKTG